MYSSKIHRYTHTRKILNKWIHQSRALKAFYDFLANNNPSVQLARVRAPLYHSSSLALFGRDRYNAEKIYQQVKIEAEKEQRARRMVYNHGVCVSVHYKMLRR